tara:strand:+ start:41772 stop:42539 length:768 start_codon:yes stop_codon:yes gene_type:complete
MRRLALAPILLLSLTACKDGNSEKPKPEEVLAEAPVEELAKPEASKDKGLLARGLGLGERALAKTSKASDLALRLADETLDDGRAFGESSLDELRRASEAVLAASDGQLGSIQSGINHLVGAIAVAPNVSQRDKIERIFILMVPVIGPSKRYLDARATYRLGREQSDDEQLALARRETLMACAEMGLDVGTLGLLGGGVDMVATGADKVLGALKIGRAVNVLTGSDSDVLSAYLDSMLENDHLRATVDASLNAGA